MEWGCHMMKKQDVEKRRFWQRTIREAARSGMSIREFCRQHRLKESQFYWWQRNLKAGRQERRVWRQEVDRGAASFALVSEEPGTTDAGIELVLGDGRRLRISKGVDEQTLRAVLAAVEPSGC
jgi:transposase-like protein